MKIILPATDFSKSAFNACLFAYNLANSFNAKLIVYTAYQDMPFVLPQMPPITQQVNLKEFTEELLRQEIRQFDSALSVPVETACSENSSTEGILEIVGQINPDLLVVGMKQHIKALERIFGSTVKALTGKINVPMLIVPENQKYNCV